MRIRSQGKAWNGLQASLPRTSEKHGLLSYPPVARPPSAKVPEAARLHLTSTPQASQALYRHKEPARRLLKKRASCPVTTASRNIPPMEHFFGQLVLIWTEEKESRWTTALLRVRAGLPRRPRECCYQEARALTSEESQKVFLSTLLTGRTHCWPSYLASSG